MATADKPAGKAADKPGKASGKPAVGDGMKVAGKAARKPSGKPAGKHAAAPKRAAASERAASAALPAGWGQDLDAYPEWVRSYLPALHDGFNYVNRYVSVPMLRAGLGMYMSNPVTGYLMMLRTRGRRSGEMRDAPLGYVIVGDAVYCMAGFGSRTNWLLNVKADPRVEVVLPGRSFSGLAEEVTDKAERQAVLPQLLRSMGLVVLSMGMGNPWKMEPYEMVRKCEGLPLVRVRATGIAAGPADPGGRYWVVPAVASALALVWLLRRGGSRR
jgi:deazaflavin-dependent oxidoreductase (nitroreductase family)